MYRQRRNLCVLHYLHVCLSQTLPDLLVSYLFPSVPFFTQVTQWHEALLSLPISSGDLYITAVMSTDLYGARLCDSFCTPLPDGIFLSSYRVAATEATYLLILNYRIYPSSFRLPSVSPTSPFHLPSVSTSPPSSHTSALALHPQSHCTHSRSSPTTTLQCYNNTRCLPGPQAVSCSARSAACWRAWA